MQWKTTCDGKWDCPGGADENVTYCQKRQCRGQFKCHASSVCVAESSTCDDILDCPIGDDEWFCNPKIPLCSPECSCLLFSISCVGLTVRLWHIELIASESVKVQKFTISMVLS